MGPPERIRRPRRNEEFIGRLPIDCGDHAAAFLVGRFWLWEELSGRSTCVNM